MEWRDAMRVSNWSQDACAVSGVELNPTETRIVAFVEGTNNANETRDKAAAVCQTVFRQYRCVVLSAVRGVGLVRACAGE